jgi:glycosyltransferase involved in cell wall biosynthesis
VIDEVNTIPFFTPLWSDIPVFMLIHQLARTVWWYESPFPINAIGYAVEPLYLRCYRKEHVLTVSASTKGDLRNLGFTGPITIVPEGVQPGFPQGAVKAESPTFLYVGRFAPSKRIEDIVKAFHAFRREASAGELWLIGEGDARYTGKLQGLVRDLGMQQTVHFLGGVTLEEKYARMGQAHVLLMASVREGWGLAVSEANACGTPAIVYDVHGLRDSVLNERTGLVVGESPQQLASAMVRVWRDPELYKSFASSAERLGQELTFERATAVVRDALVGRLNSRAPEDNPLVSVVVPKRNSR